VCFSNSIAVLALFEVVILFITVSVYYLEFLSQDEFMMELKSELNAVKEKLSEFDIGNWNQHTTRMNPASKVKEFVYSYHSNLCVSKL